MRVFGLSGKSGTGKSYQALNLCREKNIEYIIDDGLLIFRSAVIAGKSAKRQDTMIGAIKTALFTDLEHQADVEQAIKDRDVQSILIIGTSDRMVEKIAMKLKLSEINEIVHIDDITSEKEREVARIQRKQHGKHVIPAATFQIKHQFSGYFLNPLKMLQQKMGSVAGAKDMPERSVVRPTYSYLGGYSISDKVISDIIIKVCDGVPEVHSVSKIVITNNNEGIKISANVILRTSADICKHAELLQEEIAKNVEYMTAFNILFITLTVKGVI